MSRTIEMFVRCDWCENATFNMKGVKNNTAPDGWSLYYTEIEGSTLYPRNKQKTYDDILLNIALCPDCSHHTQEDLLKKKLGQAIVRSADAHSDLRLLSRYIARLYDRATPLSPLPKGCLPPYSQERHDRFLGEMEKILRYLREEDSSKGSERVR